MKNLETKCYERGPKKAPENLKVSFSFRHVLVTRLHFTVYPETKTKALNEKRDDSEYGDEISHP